MSSQQLTISLNEVLFFFTRAGFGVNAPIGVSEDFARSNIWLGENGFDPSLCSILSLDYLDEKKSSLVIELDDDGFRCSTNQYLSALQASVSAVDWIKSNKGSRLTIANVDSPLLVVASLGANQVDDWQIRWTDEAGDNYQVKMVADSKWQVITNSDNIIERSKGANMVLCSTSDDDEIVEGEVRNFDSAVEKNKILQTGVSVNEHWDTIYAYFARCLVKSTAESRASGAGAGLVDTD